jgi:hypothetical protein
MHPTSLAGRWLAVLALGVLAGCAVFATPAHAATTGTIPGTPLTVYANDAGQLQVAFNGAQSGEFYNGALAPADGGFTAAVQSPASGLFTVYGRRGGTAFTSATTPTLTGDGSSGNPWKLTTAFTAGLALNVSETVQYVNGTNDVTVTYTVGPGQSPGTSVRLYESADVLPASSYFATGFLNDGPPRRVGAQALGRTGGGSNSLVEISPWSAFQEGAAGTVDNVISNTSPSSRLNNTVQPTATNNGAGVGVQWDLGAVTTSTSVAVTWHFSRTSALDLVAPLTAPTAGSTIQVPVTARNNDGGPDAGLPVRYTITGANPGGGAATTGADGTALISWLGAKTGTDTLTAFVDRDGNGAWDVNTEPRQIVTVTIAPLPPPVAGKSVNVNVVSGQVFLKLPAGRSGRATGPAKGFVPLTGQKQIPVGSQLDTRKGRIALTSVADTGGKKTQASDFYDGIFQVKQSVPKKKPKKAKPLITDIVLKGQIARSQCAPLKGARSATTDKKKGPKAVLGKLWGNGKGKFRTNGKYSSATVRGTIWLTQDECDGTLTKVRRGVVQVRDFKRKKTVIVKAGHSYLARAQRAASKAKRRVK